MSARAGDERGSVLVIFAVCLPVLVLMGSFVIDVANWFAHDRHLQTQADAAALAAAQEVTGPACRDDAAIAEVAAQYSGTGDNTPYNRQIGNTLPASVHMQLNQKNYHGQSKPNDDTQDCADMVDVKLTETDLPWFFRVANVPFVNAHARVQIKKLEAVNGALPLAVNDTKPKKVRVQFVDESTNTVIRTADLESAGNANGLSLWDNAAAPASVAVNTLNVGVRVMVSGAGTFSSCTDAYVTCFEKVLHVQGYSGDGTPTATTAPLSRGVTLLPNTCGDAYFSGSGVACDFGVRAVVDFGVARSTNTKVTATVNGTDHQLTGGSGSVFQLDAGIPLPAGAGQREVALKWEITDPTVTIAGLGACKNGGGNKCKGTFPSTGGFQQRAVAKSETASGPIKLAEVVENGLAGANSFRRCTVSYTTCTHNLVVRVGLEGSLAAAQAVSDPVYTLRYGDGNQTHALQCDGRGASFLQDNVSEGCSNPFTVNNGTDCPGTAQAVFDMPSPFECIGVLTGEPPQAVARGLNERILGSQNPASCTRPNDWASYPDLDKADPRIVKLFLTPYGSFVGSGNAAVPIQGFATFYVTGWKGNGGGADNPCAGAGDDPAQSGEVVGHFISYVDSINEGGASEEPCDFDLTPCVPVLTR